MVLRRLARGATLLRVDQRTHLRVAPSFTLVVAGGAPGRHPGVPRQEPGAAGRTRDTAAALVERVVRRGRRHEIRLARTAPLPAADPAPPAAPARVVERVFRRPTAAAPPATPAAAPLPPSPPEVRRPAEWAPAAEAPRPRPFLPQELDRVTDHVVRAIDRRVRAHRERLGRS
jgi:hypothetical protein